jgi:hypothetical protein
LGQVGRKPENDTFIFPPKKLNMDIKGINIFLHALFVIINCPEQINFSLS